jgi:geranylgeranyl diphosphate synthase, type II
LAGLKKKVEAKLDQSIPQPSGSIGMAWRALRYSALSAGHRWRPILFLTMIGAMGGSAHKYIGAAVGIELLHTSTLIIDDLPSVDNAETRRHRPTCHVRFGVENSIYASHIGFDIAAALIVEAVPALTATRVIKMIKALKSDLVAGQSLERSLARACPKRAVF